ncbi:MAG: hypothetical protein IJA71_07605, partial [Clostridia bacterium]|nr:hypothetical protein [Clostridia bacterium]
EQLLTPEGLEKVVFSVTNRCILLGFQAFAVPALGTPETARVLLSAADGDADAVRPLWDLAMKNHGGKSTELRDRASDEAFDAFLSGQALFCLASSADLEIPEHVRLLPIPTADGPVVGLDFDGWWCVNGDASAADIEASVAFLDWVLTEKADVFPEALPYGEGAVDFITQQAMELDARRVPLDDPDAAQLDRVTDALAAYAADPYDGSWEPVREAFRK